MILTNQVNVDPDLKIGKYGVSYLLKRAAQILDAKSRGSDLFDEEAENSFPRFNTSELEIGNLLGQGGFCDVFEISKIRLKDDPAASARTYEEDEEDIEDKFRQMNFVQDRAFISTRCLRKREDGHKDARYAIKKLGRHSLNDPHRYVAAVIDLAFEARFLSVLRHPNIIKMRAVAVSSPHDTGFFIILDRLYDTLSDRIQTWKAKSKKLSGFQSVVLDIKGSKKRNFLMDRLMFACDISTALSYLHSMNVIYRDLKPDNIGFDVRGDVKIFDFGLAKELNSTNKLDDDTYQLSGNTGSLRYMAPEVASEKPYNHKVDVYSFGILLWQMITLETPFRGYDVNMHSMLVVEQGQRPKITSSVSVSISKLLENCWHKNYAERPEFQDVAEVLRDEISSRYHKETAFADVSNRTANSLLAA